MAFYQFMFLSFVLGVIVGLLLSCWCRYKCSRQRTLENTQVAQPKAKAAPKMMALPPEQENPNVVGDEFDPPQPMPIIDEFSDSDSSSSHHFDRCTTPGCSRPRNLPYRTCCQFCPATYSHSDQCQQRCGYPPINRLRLDDGQAAPRQPDIAIEIPQRVAVTQTGSRYHFNSRCAYFRQEDGPRGRMYTPCQICVRAGNQLIH